MSYVMNRCEIQVSDGRGYTECNQEATRISHWGILACEAHASVRNARLGTVDAKEGWEQRRRLGVAPARLTNLISKLQRRDLRLLGF